MLNLLRSFVCLVLAFVFILAAALPPSTAEAANPGNNGKLLISRDSGATENHLYTINPDGTGETLQTPGPGWRQYAQWSPQGSHFVYMDYRNGVCNQVYMHNIQNGAEMALSCGWIPSEFAWAPDGSSVLVTKHQSGEEGIYFYDFAAETMDLVIPGRISHPVWSPSGQYIAYTQFSYDFSIGREAYNVFVLDIFNSELHQITHGGADAYPTDWSPDSTQLAYINRDNGFSRGELFFSTPDGTEQTSFDSTAGDPAYGIYSAVWSPDGTSLAYNRQETISGNWVTRAMVTDGLSTSDPTRVLATNASVSDWQPVNDTRWVYRFWSHQNGHHFFTASYEEALIVMLNYPNHIWTYEGVSFSVESQPSCAPGRRVHRFWSSQNGTHFYTISEQEKQVVIDLYDDFVWKYEGVAYCASPTAEAGTTPLYRFWSDQNGGHFYTTNEQEKQIVIDQYDDRVWRYEGVAYYVH